MKQTKEEIETIATKDRISPTKLIVSGKLKLASKMNNNKLRTVVFIK
jgi:hypothetical protein